MAVPYHTHTFEIPIATKDDVIAGVSTEKALTPSSVGTAASMNIEDFATAEQGKRADEAILPSDLAAVATSGDYNDLKNRPVIGNAASHDASDFATAGQGRKADSALQPADVKSAAHHEASEFATAAQGAKADTGLQPADVKSAAHHDASDFATAAQGQKADSAVQPGSLKGLAYKDKVTVADIDAVGSPNATTFLAGDGKWSMLGGTVFKASSQQRFQYGISRGQSVSFKATSQGCMVNAFIILDHAINFQISVTMYVGFPSGAVASAGSCTIHPSSTGQPQQVTVVGVVPNLIPGQAYSVYLQVECGTPSASDTFSYNLAGACV